MATINKLVCVGVGANTGFGDCVLVPGIIVGALLFRRKTEIDATDLEALQASLEALAQAAEPKNRMYPIHGFEQPQDGTEDKTVQTMAYGGKYPVREGSYDWKFQFVQGGLCLHKSLRKFNGTGIHVLFYDANGVIYGVKSGTSLQTIPLQFFWADPWKANDGANVTQFWAQFVFKPEYLNDQLGFVKADFNISDIVGLQDVALSLGAGSARPALKVLAKAGCDQASLYDLYSTELAVAGAWIATAANGNAITITSVAADAAIGGWTITLDNTDADYAAAPAPITIRMAAPSVLAGLGVVGFESNSLTVTT